jgi:replicative DNA helicase
MNKKNQITVEEIKSWLEENSLKYRDSGNDLILNCPLCTDTKSRFGIKKVPNAKKGLEVGAWNCFNCFPSYSAITLSDGSVKPISDIAVGDEVVTGSGAFEKVTHVHNNGVREKLLRIKASGNNTLECTQEHKIAVITKENVVYGRQAFAKNRGVNEFGKVEYIEASKIKSGDWLVSPKTFINYDISSIELGLEKYKSKRGPKPKAINDLQILDEDLGFIMGLYCAEGSYNRGMFFSLNKDETKIAARVRRIFKSKFDLDVSAYDYSHRGVLSLFVGHSLLGKWFDCNLGHCAENKKVPDFIFKSPKSFRKGFLRGLYAGDGAKGRRYTLITTVSKHLGVQGKMLAQSLGLYSGVQRKEPYVGKDGIYRKATYHNYISKSKKNKTIGSYETEEYYVYRVKDISEVHYGGEVFDLTVENEHTYTVNGISVHNCSSSAKKFNSLKYALNQKTGTKFKTKDVIKKEDPDGDEEKSSTLPKDFHVKYIKNLEHPKYDVKRYLIEDRKLTPECLEYFQLGGRKIWTDKYGKKRNHGDHLAIPYLRDGECINVKYRSLDPNVKKGYKWRREKGGMSWLFNDAVIDDFDYDEIILAESEIDCMSLWSLGFKNTIGLTIGAKGFKQAWYERLLRFKKIYLVLDADGVGQEGARLLARRLGLNRCFNVELPSDAKDPNDFIQKYDEHQFQGLLDKATQFDVPAVKSLGTILKDIHRKRFIENNEDVRGWEFPWRSIQEKAGSIKPGHLVVLAARPKVGKCCSASTIVINPETMMPLTIEQAIKNKQKTIHSYNEATKKIEVSEISDWIDSGVKPLVRLQTRLGRYVETTYSHRYLTFNGWKYVSELQLGEKIAIPTKFGFFGNEDLSQDECFLLGALIADGGLSGREITYTKKDKILVEKTKKVGSIFNADLVLRSVFDAKRPDSYRFNKNSELRAWLESFGENVFCLSKNKKVPNRVFGLKKECIAAFISSLWSHDGSVQAKNGRYEIEYSSASEELIDGLVHLLVRFGINMRKRHKKVKLKGKVFDAWIISSSQAETVERFLSTFTLVGEKAIKDFRLSEKMNRDYLTSYPSDMWEIVLREISEKGFSLPDIYEAVFGDRASHFKKSGGCSREMLSKINKVINSDLLQSFIDSDISFTAIESIEDIGEHQCYDLTVPCNENFIANDIVCHNSTLSLDMTRRMAKGHQRINTGMYSCEMNLDTLGEKLVTQALSDLYSIDDLTQEQISYASMVLPIKRMHFYQPLTAEDLELDKVCELIEEAVIRYNIKIFIFDNLHFLCRDEDEYTAIGKATQRFKLLAEKLRIGMVLITHPRKGDSNKKLRPDDLKGSSSIFQDADLVLLMNREAVDPDDLTEDEMEYFTGSLSPVTEVDFIGRWTTGGRVRLFFNEDRALFKDDGADFDKMEEFLEDKRAKRN